MSVGGILEELAVKLGLDVDETGFFKAEGAIKLVQYGLSALKEVASEAWEELAKLAPETAKFAREAEVAALRTGLTVEAFQELRFAASEAGISAEGLEGALFRMSRAAYEAKHNGGEAADAFKGLLTLQDLKTLNPDEMFMKLAESLSEVADTGKRNDEVMRIFGRGMGAQIIPLLSRGREGLEELRKEAHTFGQVLDGETLEASERYRLNNLALEHSIEGLKMALGGEILKALGDFKKGLADFFNSIRPGVVMAFRVAIRGLTEAFSVLGWVINTAVLQPFRNVAQLWKGDVAGGMLGLIEAGTLLGVVFGVVGAEALAAGVAAVGAWIAALAPILAIIAGVTVLLLWLDDVKTFFEGGDSLTGDFVAAVKDAFADLVPWLKNVWNGFTEWIVQKAKDIGHAILDALMDALRTAGKFWSDIIGGIPLVGKLLNGNAPSFGGGDSPAAQAANSSAVSNTNNAANMSAQIQVNVPPGTTNPETIGKATADALDDWHSSTWGNQMAGVGGF